MSAAAAAVWRAVPESHREGGYVRVGYQGHARVRSDGGGFGMVRAEAVEHLPIPGKPVTLSLRVRLDTTFSAIGDVPYFLLPSIGGGSTLSGYITDRFRDRDTLVFSGAWRWFPREWAEVAVFADAGGVGARTADLALGDMKGDIGVGFRARPRRGATLRLDAAHGGEGWRLVLGSALPF